MTQKEDLISQVKKDTVSKAHSLWKERMGISRQQETGSFLKNWLYLVLHRTLERALAPMTHTVTRIFSATRQRPSRRFRASKVLPSHLLFTSIQKLWCHSSLLLCPCFQFPPPILVPHRFVLRVLQWSYPYPVTFPRLPETPAAFCLLPLLKSFLWTSKPLELNI